MSIADRLDLWRTIEALTVQDVLRLDPHDAFAPVYGVSNDPDALFPWQDVLHTAKRSLAGKEWRYDAQCGVHSSDAISKLLLTHAGETEFEDVARNGNARLFDLSFDKDGYPLARTFSLSLAAWAAGQVVGVGGSIEVLRNGGRSDVAGLPRPEHSIASACSGFPEFDSLSRSLVQWVINETAALKERATPANITWVASLVALVMEHTGLPLDVLDSDTAAHVKSVQVKVDGQGVEGAPVKGQETPEILSSFYIEDLNRVKKASMAGDVGAGFRQLMQCVATQEEGVRIDVRSAESEEYLADALAPNRMPPGRWPSDHALVFSQQVGVNEAWRMLADQPGLFSVNGPPGTGKTTLLRDVVAAVVTRRAEILVHCTSPFGTKQAMRIGDTWVPYYTLAKSLHGHSIVVASANNGAVENVTRELPGLAAVPERVASHSDYFMEIAGNVTQRESWGLLAAPLGNGHNRREFLRRFWWAKKGERSDIRSAGLRERLKDIQSSGSAPAMTWQLAVERYTTSAAHEKSIRDSLSQAASRPARIASLATRIADDAACLDSVRFSLGVAEESLAAAEKEFDELQRESLRTLKALNNWETRSKAHALAEPGLLAWIRGFGKTNRQWAERTVSMQIEYEDLTKEWKRQDDCRDTLLSKRDALRSRVADIQKRADGIGERTALAKREQETLQLQLQRDLKDLGGAWPRLNADSDDREKTCPWATAEWMAAREDLFLAALDVHRAFIECHPTEMLANLNLASDWLGGKSMPGDLAQTALETLCLVVPVISTTFASVPRMFASIGREGIGWLLVDEAGQAMTQHAAGAVWRAKRTVVVGDPLQLEPVYSMPAQLEAMLGTAFKVSNEWWPSFASMQTAADRTACVGTTIARDTGESTWVGCPLRLHRRCDEPMFSISNRIAYGGLMVHGKVRSAATRLPESAWIDVQSDRGEGHWIPEEGDQVEWLLSALVSRYQVPSHQIAMISPFRDCARKLRDIARAYALDPGKVGTVHTAQGREADVVILVLGGNPRVPGAKAWVAAKPNLLNVAVSRAKQRIYVVGNHSDWARHKGFDEMARLLPVSAALEVA